MTKPEKLVVDYLKEAALEVQSLEKVSESTTSYTYKLSTGSRLFFLKLFKRVDNQTETLTRALSEYTVLNSAPNVPRCLHFSKNPPIILSEYITGVNLEELVAKDVNINHLIDLLAEWITGFHMFFGECEASPQSVERARLIVVVRELLKCPLLRKERKRELLEKLRSFPKTETCVRLHGDTTLKNFFYVGEGDRLIGTDFEFTHTGDPAKDIGLACASILLARAGANHGNILRLIDRYETVTGFRIFANTLFYIPYFLFWIRFSDPRFSISDVNKSLDDCLILEQHAE